MADPRLEILEIWRSNLFEIERRVAIYGGDTQTPLHLVSLRDQARAEIEKLERDLAGSFRPVSDGIVPTATELSVQLDYRFQLESLRRDMASWQAAMSRELLSMTDDQVKPLQTILFEMSRRLDAINQTMTAIQKENAVISHRLSRLEVDFGVEDRGRIRWLINLAVGALVVAVVIMLLHYLGVPDV